MVDRVTYKVCRCGESIVIMATERGKRIAVNQNPSGPHQLNYEPVHRLETMYRWGTHQPHVATCTRKRHSARRKYV